MYILCISKSNPDAIFSFCFLKEPIPGHIRSQILSELKDLRDVSELLSMLEMAIGFLSTAGGNPQMKISDYLKSVLLLSEGKSSLKSKKVGIEWVNPCWLSLHVTALAYTLSREGIDILQTFEELVRLRTKRNLYLLEYISVDIGRSFLKTGNHTAGPFNIQSKRCSTVRVWRACDYWVKQPL